MNNKTGQHEKRTETPVPADAPAAWAYILAKIDLYLSLGAKKYRKLDALHMPDAAWDEDTLQDILRCFQQFAAGKGYRADKPTEGVTVGGFYAAMQTLHFSLAQQSTTQLCNDEGQSKKQPAFLDKMLFKHAVSGQSLPLFNAVAHDNEER